MTAHPAWTPAPRAGFVPLHPLSFGTVLGRAFVALRRNPRVLLGFALGMQMLAYLVLLVVLGGITFFAFERLATVPTTSADYDALFAGSFALTIVAGLVLGIATTALTVVVQGVVTADVAHGVVGEKLTVGALFRRMRPAFWRLVGYTFLTVAAVLLVVAVGFGVAFGIGTLALPVGIVVGVLLVLAAIPIGCWIITKLLLVTPLLVIEGCGIFAAIARSWRLTRGRFWRTFGVWILVQIIFGVLAQILVTPLSFLGGILSGVVAPTGAPDASAVLAVIAPTLLAQVVSLLVQSIALVVYSTAATLVYVDARMRTEGLDLDLQSYVDQRQAGAGVADPYRWHVGAAGTARAHRLGRPRHVPGRSVILRASAVPLIPDGDEARRWAEQELSDPAYRAAEPTVFDRAAKAIGDAIAAFFAGGAGPTWGPIVAIVALVIVLALIVLAFVLWGRPRASARATSATRGSLFGDDTTASAAALRALAREHADTRDWDAAIAAAVRAVARSLDERGIVETPPGATVHAFARAAAASFPAESDALESAARDFDDVRYLRRPGTSAGYDRVRALDDRLTAAPAVRP